MINIQFLSGKVLGNNREGFNRQIKSPPKYLTGILLIFFNGLIFFNLYESYQGDYRPQGIHFWAQADRFSIARNYYDNGLDFLKPQTNYLETGHGYTGVEFPGVQYLTALIAKPFGARDELFLIYRFLSFLFLCLGLHYLLLTVKMHGGNGFQQLLIPLLFILSPVLLFYGFNLLPDIPSLSMVLVGYYYFERFRLKLDFSAIYYALAFGFLAALFKLTSTLFPVAFFTWFLANAFFIDKQITRPQILKVLSGFMICLVLCFGINYYFTVLANAKYNSSVFLSKSRHINAWTDFSDIWLGIVCWHREYFRETQYWVFLAAFIVSLNLRYLQKGVMIFKVILILGFCCFILLMGKQLMDHDYYAICTIIPIILMLSIDGLMILTRGCLGSLILLYIVYNMAPYSLGQAQQRQADVYHLPCRVVWDFRGYMVEGAEWIKKQNIPRNARIIVMYDFPLNTPLVYLDRKGMVLDHRKMKDKDLVYKWLNIIKPMYVLLPIQWKNEFETDRPELLPRLEKSYHGKEVLVFKVKY